MTATTSASPLTMRSVRGEYFLSLQNQLGAAWHTSVASVFDTNQPSEDYPWLTAVPNLAKWEGERTMRKLQSSQVTIVTDDYETGVSFHYRDWRRDKTSQMQARVADMAARVAMFPESLLTSLITTNGNAYDGTAFFADHGDNDNLVVAGELAGGAAPTTEQMSANLLTVLSRMLGFVDDKGQPINEAGREFVVMVPPALYGVTVAAINASFTSSGASNPVAELRSAGINMTAVVNARLTAGDEFYMMRTDSGIRPFIVQQEMVDPVELGPESEHRTKTNHVYFGHGWAGGVGYGRYELACKGDLVA